jgi:predicted RNA binding protein YcfA (HicA-like mRNA interferase family)
LTLTRCFPGNLLGVAHDTIYVFSGDAKCLNSTNVQRIRSLDRNLRFDELQKVLEHYGYTMSGPAGGSSHKSFRKPGKNTITIPQHNPIKRAYVEEVKAVVESEDESDENN